MLKILFVNPKFHTRHPQLGLGYLSSYLKKYLNVPVKIRLFDEVTSMEDISSVTYDFKPDLIGISIITPTYKHAIALCQRIRSVTKAPIVAGGIHVTALPECIMETPIDVGVIGEGEATLLEVVEYYLKTGEVANSNIAGIVYKEGDSLIYTPKRPLITNIDTIPPPDRTLFDMEYYTKPGVMVHGLYAKGTSMMPSRGCPYNKCNFCSSNIIWGNKVRFFSPEYVVNEIQSIVDNYGLNFIVFLDDNFTTRLEWLEKFCRLLDVQGLTNKVKFDCESIAAFMNDRKAAILKKAGCVRIEFGFESGCPRILHILKAGKSCLKDNEQAIDICRRFGISVLGNMIVGYIDETPEEFKESVTWFRKQSIDYIAPHLYIPYPKTDGWNECIDRGLIDPIKVDWEQFATGCSQHDLYVNIKFPPGELDQQRKAFSCELNQRNKVIVIDNNLSLKDKLKLYSSISKVDIKLFLRRTNRLLPRIYIILGRLMQYLNTRTLYHKTGGFLKKRCPTFYHIIRYIKYSMGPNYKERIIPVRMEKSLWAPMPNDKVFESIRKGSPFEQRERDFVKSFLQYGMTFWDIGANFGLYTILAAKKVGKKGKILAIEPDPRNRLFLYINVFLNLLFNVKILHMAVGNNEHKVDFLSCSQGAYSGLKVAKVPGKIKKIKVQQTTLDIISSEHKWEPVDFLKVDVEGAEKLILEGGKEFFTNSPRPILMCEFSDRRSIAFGYKAKQIYNWLEDKGYQWFSFSKNDKLVAQPPKDTYDYDNLIACPEEKLNLLSKWIR